jgi:hypothetical protein
MRQKTIIATTLIFMAVSMASCKKQSSEKETPVVFQTLKMEEKHHLKNNDQNPLLSVVLNLQFPSSYGDPKILDKIRAIILADFFQHNDSLNTEPKAAMKAYIKERIKLYEESEEIIQDEEEEDVDGGSQVAWKDNETMLVRYNAKSLLSYTIESAQFSGGAHGGKSFRNTVINLKNGERLTEDDLFTEESKPLINEMILKKLMEQNEVDNAEDLAQIGYFDVSEIGQYKNFYLTTDGIVYTFNEYEIAAYALGTIEVKINFKDMAGFVLPGSPIEPLIP